MTDELTVHQLDFAGWIGSASERAQPTRWKQALLVLVGLYPTVMLLSLTLGPILASFQIPQFMSVFLTNMAAVTILTWLIMPRLSQHCGAWLNEQSSRFVSSTLIMLLLLIALYLGVFSLVK